MAAPGEYFEYPQQEPLEPPDAEVSEAPAVTVIINETWRSFVVGELQKLTYPTSWLGDETKVSVTINRVEQLIAMFMTGYQGVPGQVCQLDDPVDAVLDQSTFLAP